MSDYTSDAGTDKNAAWIPLLEYAVKTGISASTIRRHIKSNKIEYKIENGKYLLKSSLEKIYPQESISVFSKVQKLEDELKAAHEQISELKMLVSIYEEQLGSKKI
jgi:hypothetical protein